MAQDWSLTVGRGHESAQELFPDRYYWLRDDDLPANPGKGKTQVWRFLDFEAELAT